MWVLWGLCCRQGLYTSSHIKFKDFQGPHFKISRTLTDIPNKLWIYFDNTGNQLLLFGATILKICVWVHTWLSFPQCRFYSAGFKPVFANFFWRFKNIPQLKFKDFQRPKWRQKNFKSFKPLKKEKDSKIQGIFKGFQDTYEPCAGSTRILKHSGFLSFIRVNYTYW